MVMDILTDSDDFNVIMQCSLIMEEGKWLSILIISVMWCEIWSCNQWPSNATASLPEGYLWRKPPPFHLPPKLVKVQMCLFVCWWKTLRVCLFVCLFVCWWKTLRVCPWWFISRDSSILRLSINVCSKTWNEIAEINKWKGFFLCQHCF